MSRRLLGTLPRRSRGRRGWGALLAAALVAGALLGAPTAHAATAPSDVAEQLHLKAREAYEAKQLKRAIELWREAYDAHAVWKYAYNLANALREDGQYAQAWDYVGRAEALGVPDEYAAYVLDLRSFIRAELTRDHALLTLTVDPPDALVIRNGAVWPAPEPDPTRDRPAPREMWTRDAASEVVVSKDGYVPQTLAWRHGDGVHERRVVLLPVPRPGTLSVSGTPVGAVIVLDDEPVGSLPALRLPVDPGKHVLAARAPGYVIERRPITIESERELHVDFTLEPEIALGSRADLATPGWIVVGSSAALIMVGAGFTGWADNTATDLADLNASAPGSVDYDTYRRRYDALRSDFDTRRDVGAVLLGIGAAAAVTGVVLLVIDATRDDAPRQAVLPLAAITPLPGGASVSAGVAF
ncbi:MAG: PEGA domain-containing protein [Deltaproteobacteria bacterium]|nr:MAG: PEGA domain-containing protein [Deltaproteobacteria bacterium]